MRKFTMLFFGAKKLCAESTVLGCFSVPKSTKCDKWAQVMMSKYDFIVKSVWGVRRCLALPPERRPIFVIHHSEASGTFSWLNLIRQSKSKVQIQLSSGETSTRRAAKRISSRRGMQEPRPRLRARKLKSVDRVNSANEGVRESRNVAREGAQRKMLQL